MGPRQAIAVIPRYLAETFGVQFHFATPIVRVADHAVHTAGGTSCRAERILVCSGDDFRALFPEVFAGSGIRRCKLQMLRTVPQPGGWKLGPNLCAGLTMVHYDYFSQLPSFETMRQRIDAEYPFHRQHHIHLLLSQTALG